MKKKKKINIAKSGSASKNCHVLKYTKPLDSYQIDKCIKASFLTSIFLSVSVHYLRAVLSSSCCVNLSLTNKISFQLSPF